MDGGGFTITDVHLTVKAKVPGADEAAFKAAAQKAKEICPISKLLNGSIDITLDAKLDLSSNPTARGPDRPLPITRQGRSRRPGGRPASGVPP